MTDPSKILMTLEKMSEGVVRVGLHEIDPDHADSTHLLWECTVAQCLTKYAQREALKATFRYLDSFYDLAGEKF